MGDVSVLVSHSNHILDGKQDEWAWEFPEEKRRGRKGERRSFFIVSPPTQRGFTGCLPQHQALEQNFLKLSGRDVDQSIVRLGSGEEPRV